MSAQNLCLQTIAEQSRLIHKKEVSPVEVVRSALQQIEKLNHRVNAFITLMPEEALAAARKAEKEIAGDRDRGPLHGIPVAVKDLFYTEGIRTTGGSKILKDFIPGENATVVKRLKEAGAVLVGKTNMHEFAFGPVNTNPHYGDVHNPWDLTRVTGGSSGGSGAVVAARMAGAALGSDTGGSIRIPAALCGVFGIKPTYGRVSRHGVLPLAWSLDHVGPLTQTAEDAALVLRAIAGWDPQDPSSSRNPIPDYRAEIAQNVHGLKMAVLREYMAFPMDPEVGDGFQKALEVLRETGIQIEEISLPEVKYAAGAAAAILYSEASAYHEKHYRTRAKDYGPDVLERLELGFLVAATDYVNGQRVRTLLMDRFCSVLKSYDALICPTEQVTAPRLDRNLIRIGKRREARGTVLPRLTRLFNLIGLPAASVPCGFASNGMPYAFQIVGAPFAEGTVLQLAHAYQQATDWHKKLPPVIAVSPFSR
jgi:aspartyl-tRNA(Asn)/glutamyl-tRNA(Gln) amidotransferase subunit A